MIVTRKRATWDAAQSLARELEPRVRGPVAVAHLSLGTLEGLVSGTRLAADTLAGKRVVEIEQGRRFAHFFQNAGVAAATRRVEFDQVARRKILTDHAVFAQRGQRHALDQLGIARTEGDAGI